MALSGDTALIGAPDHMVKGIFQEGAVYVFTRSGSTWTQAAQITSSDGAPYDSFGIAMALSAGMALIGADRHQVGPNINQGAAYVFTQSGATWSQQAELTANDGSSGDAFGHGVALGSGTALIGATGYDALKGAAYVFTQSGSAWTQTAKLTAGDGGDGDLFGLSLALSSGTALVGASNHKVGANANQGAAYVFAQSGSAWAQQAELTASDGAPYDQFGWSVALLAGTALIGSPGRQVGANADQGAAYLFTQSGTTWAQQAELTAGDGAANDELGTSVLLASGEALVGANLASNMGAAYLFASGTPGTCTQDASCPTSHCVDGVCCDTACAGACQSCLGAKTGGVDGTCGAVTDGTACSGGTCQAGSCTGAVDGGPGTGGAAGSGGTAGSASQGATGSGGGTTAMPGGCGCRSAGGEGAPWGAAITLGALAFALRTRRRSRRSDGVN